jgi:hypothetical protein
MTEVALCRKRLKEASSRLAFVKLFEKRLQRLRPLNCAEQIQLSELKNTYQRELVCWKLAVRSQLRRSKRRFKHANIAVQWAAKQTY